ncbi:MAG: hypothetical protein D3925_00805, partial [Candidatus Electrothrix sp. AR5]|nr:hypothetical protein [Candidatus Electrothrix sp. AR5]
MGINGFLILFLTGSGFVGKDGKYLIQLLTHLSIKMTHKKNTSYLLILTALALLICGCAKEQFESNVKLEEFTQQNDQLASSTVEQNMFDSVLTAPPEEAESKLGPGDLIAVNVLESEELNTETRVSSRGYISLPILDQVEVLDVTAAEAEEKIEQLLKNHTE